MREHLRRVFPGAVGLFADIGSPISLNFLTRFDSQDRADWLSPKRLAAWLTSVGYRGKTDPAVLHARLRAAPRGATGDAVTDFAADSRRANPWAANLYNRARARGHDHLHAVRILARAWLYVIWHCWQNNTAYDPANHGALQRLPRDQQRAA